MSETNLVTCLGGLASLLISFVYRLTVKLTVELIKIGFLLSIFTLTAVCAALFFFYSAMWAYAASGGSILVTMGACALSSLCLLGAAWLVQFLIRDVLRLTDLSLLELTKLIVCATFNFKGRGTSKKSAFDISDDQDEPNAQLRVLHKKES